MDKLKLYNLDAEKNILASIFSDSSVIDIISVFLKKKEDFFIHFMDLFFKLCWIFLLKT